MERSDYVIIAAAFVVLTVLVRSAFFSGNSRYSTAELYEFGDAQAVIERVVGAPPVQRLPLLVALGMYETAIREAPRVDADPEGASTVEWLSWLNRVNLSEAYVELGDFSRAHELLDPRPPTSAGLLVEAGNGTTLAWLLTCEGRHGEALNMLDGVAAADLGKDYCAEAFLTRTLILLNLGRLDDAKVAIDECRRLTVRASTERNLLLHEARWQVLTGRIDDAIATFHLARDHRWPCQGGSGCLALGDTFRDISRLELARECWSLAVERDPESHSAKLARERLA